MNAPRPSFRIPALLALAAIALTGALVATSGADSAWRALRAGAIVALLAAGVFAVRYRRGANDPGAPPLLTIRERQALGRDTGVAVVALPHRLIVIGYGPAGVTRIAELAPTDTDVAS